MLSTSFPQRHGVSSRFHPQPGATAAAAAAAVSERTRTSGFSVTCHHASTRRRSDHSTTSRSWRASRKPSPPAAVVATIMSALPVADGTATATSAAAGRVHVRPAEHQQDWAGSTQIRGRRRTALGARGGGRSGGDSSRRRTDRPDEYSAERKKGKGRGGRGGRSGGRGGRSSGSSSDGIGSGSGAPSPFETDVGELWGGESRLSSLDDKAPAEFSRKIDCSELSRKPKYYSVEATEQECAALAQRFSCERITGLKADLRVVRGAHSDARRIKIKGRVVGEVTQSCAATLEPFVLPVEREFNTIVQEVSLDSVESTLWALEKDTETDDEIMEGDPLDLGEVAAQTLALCIDPFAKHPDFVSTDGGGGAVANANQPYAAGRFGMPAEGEDEVLDVEAMRAFFDADD
ncbi:unnamed protein product [Scytosiphon promiscuus]